MSIWDMSGADLSREIGQPAPVTVLRGGHTPSLADVAALIAALSASDREELVKALAPAPRAVKRLTGGLTFKDADAFFLAFNAARAACREEYGEQWYLNPVASLMARVPAAWVALRGEQGIWRSPRDVNFPAARFWPGGMLPIGPDYAEHGPVSTGDASADVWGDVLVLEPPPDGEMEIREAA